MTTINTLFHVGKGHQLALNAVELASDRRDAIAYVARSHRNNGITAWVQRVDGLAPAEAGDISVCLRSRNHAMSAFVQPHSFYTTYHVAVLTPRKPMGIQERLWWCLCIRANRFRFHFGRQANRTVGSLALPDEIPAWAATMEPPRHAAAPSLDAGATINTSSWETFRLLDLFSYHVGQYTAKRDLERGLTPIVTASVWNNGITDHIAAEPDWSGGQITVANNGNGVGVSFYQPRPFAASRDVTILDPRMPLSAAAALFICAVLRKESVKYNYARKWTAGRMRETSIRLPAKSGEPDTRSMEDLMKSLPLGWALP